ncbi:MAG: cytochrome c [Bacteroidia bacterium]|nr:cytochrome c [Bacteroidia bacterium]
MKNLFLMLWLIGLCGCFRHQHEERITMGDTAEPAASVDTVSGENAETNAIRPDSEVKVLFDAKCRSCHRNMKIMGTTATITGVYDRIPGGDWKYHWFRNPDSMVAAGDAYSRKVKADWGNTPHPAFPELSRREIDLLLDYISTVSCK